MATVGRARGRTVSPSAPANPAVSGTTLSWDAVSVAADLAPGLTYEVYRKRADETAFTLFGSTTSTSLANIGTGGVGGVLSFQVKAKVYGWRSAASATALADFSQGNVPGQVTGLAVTTGGFLSWDLTPDATHWTIYRQQDSSPGFESVGMAMNAGDPTWQDPDVSGFTGAYSYYVVAGNIAGDGTPSATVGVTYSTPSLGNNIVTPFDTVYDWGQTGNVTKTAATGNWSDSTKFTPSGVPGSGDTVLIPVGVTMTMDATAGVAKCVAVKGNLFFPTAANSKLTVTHLYVYSTGYLRVGTTGTPVAAANTAEIVIRDTALDTTPDPRQHGNGIVCFGKFEACGASKTHRLRCTVAPVAGATSLTFGSTPSGWRDGDKLVVHETAQVLDHTSAPWQTDLPLVSGTPSSGTVNLQGALTYNHPGAVNAETGATDYLGWVGNLTRNVKVYSENPTGTRGHIYCSMACDVDVRRVEFRGLGRTGCHPFNNSTFVNGVATSIGQNQQGKYALHFHRVMGRVDVTPQATVEDCVFAEFDKTAYPVGTTANANVPPRWACNLHGITDAVFNRNVIFNCSGSGVFNGEDGSECRNQITDNLIVRVLGTGGRPDERGGELGYEGGHIWLRSPDNYVTGNVCAEGSVVATTRPAMGITYYARLQISAMVPNFPGADQTNMGEVTMTDLTSLPIPTGGNENNELWGCGFYPWSVQSYGVSPHVNADWCEVNDLKVLNFCGYCIYNYETHKIRYNNYVVRADADGIRYRNESPIGLFSGDYVAGDHEFVNASIIGARSGIDFPNIGSWAKARFVVKDSHFHCYYNFFNCRIYYNAEIVNSKPIRKVIDNCTSTILFGGTVDLGSVFGPPGHFNSPPPNFQRGFNHDAQIDLCYVYDWNGTPGDDFIIYWDTAERGDSIAQRRQDAGAAGAVRDSGPPEAGMTNLTSWQQHRACHGGRLPPASPTTKTGFNRVVTGPILTDWLPADLTGYASGIESATHRLWNYTDNTYGPPYGGVDNDSGVGWVESPWAPFGDGTDSWKQATSGSRPTYRKNPARFEFDGGDYLQRAVALSLTGPFTLYVVGSYTASALYAIFGNTTDASGIEITAANTVKVYTAGSSVTSAAVTRTTGRHFWRLTRDGSNVIKFRSDEQGDTTVGTLSGTITINTLGARQQAGAFVASGQTFETHTLSTSALAHGGSDDLAVRAYITAADRGFSANAALSDLA